MSFPKQRVSIVSLGCARNLVDSEVMAGLLQKSHYEMVQEPGDAECGTQYPHPGLHLPS